MLEARALILNEIRYAQRLCQRTARLYRHVQTFGTVVTVIGASAALSALSSSFPGWVAVAGATLSTIFGAVLLAVRPADKAAANEVDAKRYAGLKAKDATLDDAALQAALDEARAADAVEFESLRNVAYNDVVLELGQPGYLIPLRLHQKMLQAIA